MDKASKNFDFKCRKYYIYKLLAEVSPNKNQYLQDIRKQQSLGWKLLKLNLTLK